MAEMMGPGRATMGGMPMATMEAALAVAFRAAMLQALLLSPSAAVLAAVIVSLLVSARIVTPVQRLLAASRHIAGGHYAERVPERGRDELGALAAQFNTMAAELEAARRRRVARIAGYAAGLLDGLGEPRPATWALLHDEVGRLRRLVADLQELARAEARQLPLHLATTEPAALVAQTNAHRAAVRGEGYRAQAGCRPRSPSRAGGRRPHHPGAAQPARQRAALHATGRERAGSGQRAR
ncbi:MAG TPA: HAMP domain-containing protein [Roseiflexaceae bacterium]|nr:HAMP domain-containing protein [Roseiflexaceae bacterium]